MALVSGCAKEERGPLLIGGRELKSWLSDLHDPKPVVRRQAVLKLGNVGEADPAVAEGLTAALGDQDATVRREAVLAVFKLKRPGSSIVERLEVMSRNDRDARVRDAARRATLKVSGNG
jgi:vesicle coat complex subunit